MFYNYRDVLKKSSGEGWGCLWTIVGCIISVLTAPIWGGIIILLIGPFLIIFNPKGVIEYGDMPPGPFHLIFDFYLAISHLVRAVFSACGNYFPMVLFNQITPFPNLNLLLGLLLIVATLFITFVAIRKIVTLPHIWRVVFCVFAALYIPWLIFLIILILCLFVYAISFGLGWVFKK